MAAHHSETVTFQAKTIKTLLLLESLPSTSIPNSTEAVDQKLTIAPPTIMANTIKINTAASIINKFNNSTSCSNSSTRTNNSNITTTAHMRTWLRAQCLRCPRRSISHRWWWRPLTPIIHLYSRISSRFTTLEDNMNLIKAQEDNTPPTIRANPRYPRSQKIIRMCSDRGRWAGSKRLYPLLWWPFSCGHAVNQAVNNDDISQKGRILN